MKYNLSNPNTYLEVLLDCLERTKKKRIRPHLAMCANVQDYLYENHYLFYKQYHCEIFHILKVLFKEWPEFSGSITWPVEKPLWSYNCEYWEGKYGEARMRLLDFMIDSLKLAIKTA